MFNLNYKRIGNEIRECRTNAGLTQEQLAEKLNISAVHLSNIERGKTSMSLEVIVDISKTLQVPIDVLLCSEIGLPNQKFVVNNKISEILTDCSPCELLVICDIIKATKDSLRNTYSIEDK